MTYIKKIVTVPIKVNALLFSKKTGSGTGWGANAHEYFIEMKFDSMEDCFILLSG